MSPYTRTITTTFNETDAAGFIHFSQYFRWMEETEHAFLLSLDIPVIDQSSGLIQGWPRVSAQINYHKPVSFNTGITIELYVKEVLDKGVRYQFKFLEENDLIAEAEMTTLFANIELSREIVIEALSASVRKKLEAFVTSDHAATTV